MLPICFADDSQRLDCFALILETSSLPSGSGFERLNKLKPGKRVSWVSHDGFGLTGGIVVAAFISQIALGEITQSVHVEGVQKPTTMAE